MAWSAEQYSRFENERNRPIEDLLARLPTGDEIRRAADIGCGPGNSTELLKAKYPGAELYGMDSSAEMIAAARKRLPGVEFEIDDIATWRAAGPFDVVLANAALQWVPDHAALLPRLLGTLAPGGHLAVQVPDNLAEPSHVLMRKVAVEGPWADRVADAWKTWDNRQAPEWYYRALLQGAASVDMWRTTYYHRLDGPAAIVEWVKGTSLRPFLDPLDPGEQAEFLARYQREIAGAYPALPDGSVLLPFPRLFFIARR